MAMKLLYSVCICYMFSDFYIRFNSQLYLILIIGAAFRGAGLSRQFKVKEIKVKDITPYPIEVYYTSEPKESEDGNF